MNTEKIPLILIGGGGHCKACIDIIEAEGKYEIYGILDKEESTCSNVLGYEVIGTDELIPLLVEKGYGFLVTVGQIKDASLRRRIYDQLVVLNANIVTVFSPAATVSKHASIERGSIIMHGVTINAGAVIGENNIINTGSIIEHDVKTGKHCHISTNAVINGSCVVGNESFIGSSVTVNNNIDIGDNVIVGSGSLVNRNIERGKIMVGSPAKELVKVTNE